VNDKNWYIADPMCSWCWGFAPIIEKIRERYSDRLNFGLMLGDLRPGTKEPIAFPFFMTIQHAFYDEQMDVTKPDVLAKLVTDKGIVDQ